jgi:hypothetical protein
MYKTIFAHYKNCTPQFSLISKNVPPGISTEIQDLQVEKKYIEIEHINEEDKQDEIEKSLYNNEIIDLKCSTDQSARAIINDEDLCADELEDSVGQ